VAVLVNVATTAMSGPGNDGANQRRCRMTASVLAATVIVSQSVSVATPKKPHPEQQDMAAHPWFCTGRRRDHPDTRGSRPQQIAERRRIEHFDDEVKRIRQRRR
jgi:hypothetical protein